jgi:hypothetical protein
MVAEDSGFHLMPGESRWLTVGWSGAPPSPRRILLDGFNLPTTMLTDGPPAS